MPTGAAAWPVAPQDRADPLIVGACCAAERTNRTVQKVCRPPRIGGTNRPSPSASVAIFAWFHCETLPLPRTTVRTEAGCCNHPRPRRNWGRNVHDQRVVSRNGDIAPWRQVTAIARKWIHPMDPISRDQPGSSVRNKRMRPGTTPQQRKPLPSARVLMVRSCFACKAVRASPRGTSPASTHPRGTGESLPLFSPSPWHLHSSANENSSRPHEGGTGLFGRRSRG